MPAHRLARSPAGVIIGEPASYSFLVVSREQRSRPPHYLHPPDGYARCANAPPYSACSSLSDPPAHLFLFVPGCTAQLRRSQRPTATVRFTSAASYLWIPASQSQHAHWDWHGSEIQRLRKRLALLQRERPCCVKRQCNRWLSCAFAFVL
jgi:hypothetical protein